MNNEELKMKNDGTQAAFSFLYKSVADRPFFILNSTILIGRNG